MRSFAAIVLYALLAVLVIPVFPHFMSPNEFSRWVSAVAVVDFHTLEATPVIRMTGIRMDDLSNYQGRLYSNKAPGAALVGLPGYAMARAIVGPPQPGNVRTTLNAMRLMASTIPALLAAFWLRAAARRFGCSEQRAAVAVVAALFATPLFAYGLLFFAHALSALAIFAAWALLLAAERRPRNNVLAGAMVGLAVLSEYPMAIPAAVILLCALPLLRLRGTLRVGLGGAPFALLLGLYNKAAFGSFFSLSSGHEDMANLRELASSGLFGVGLPSIKYMGGLLVDPSKGLFVLSPVLLLALGGLGAAWRALSKPAFFALVGAPLSILLTIGGYPNWFGGWTVGARYLVAAVPFVALLLAFARETVLEPLLLGASVAAVAMVSLVFPFVPPEYPAPWITFAWPILRHGFIAPNLLHLVARPLALAVPFALVAMAAVAAVPMRRAGLLAVGAIVWIAAGFLAARSMTQQPYIRALVEEVHFGRKGTIVETLPPTPQRRTLEIVAPRMHAAPPPDWPY
jgi:hypothetical protein